MRPMRNLARGLAGIRIRPLRPRHVPVVNRHFNRIFGEYLKRHVELMRVEPAVYGRSGLPYCFGAFCGKELVAQSAARPVRLSIENIHLLWATFGNVYTLPQYRGRGISSEINRRLWEKLRKMGVDGVYISGGRSLYTRAGAVHCGDYLVYSCPLPRSRFSLRSTGSLAIRQAGPADSPLMVALTERQRTGFAARPADLSPLLKARTAHLRPAVTWLVTYLGAPVACVVLAAGDGLGRTGWVVDYAGSRQALSLALPAILKRAHFGSVEIAVARRDFVFRRLLNGWCRNRPRYAGIPGTQLLLDPIRLMRRLSPYLRARLGNSPPLRLRRLKNGAYEWSCQSRRFRQPGLSELTRLILGAEPRSWAKLLPRNSFLRDRLRAVFPLPFPPIGIHWI